jgi:hypothetical protein
MSKNGLLAAAAVLALGGCNSDPAVEAKNASADEVSGQIADAGGPAAFVSPGKWQSKVTFEEMTIPGLPKEATAQMQGFAGQSTTSENCLSEEDAKKPKEDFFAGGKGCTYERFTMAGGKIDASMSCKEDQQTSSVTMQGNYAADTYDARMTMTTANGEQAGMTMRMRVEAKRVGACEAGSDA